MTILLSSNQGFMDKTYYSPSVTAKSERSQPETFRYLKIIITAQLTGKASLPYQLGLDEESYQALLTSIDDDEINRLNYFWLSKSTSSAHEKSHILETLVSLRQSERDALITLLKRHHAQKVPFSEQAAVIVATACLNPSHLWKSLGFNIRKELSEWLTINFPHLAENNTQNMRWKRFFYLKLCQEGGDYVCRAPSCDECSSFSECFDPE